MSTSEEFLLRETTYEEEVKIDEARSVVIRVSRTRTSTGQAAIFLKIGNLKRIEISNGAETYGNAYTEVAMSISELLEKAVGNSCTLPEDDTCQLPKT